MSKTMKERIILISFCLTIILLLSIYVSYTINLFKPYYKIEVFINYKIKEVKQEYYFVLVI